MLLSILSPDFSSGWTANRLLAKPFAAVPSAESPSLIAIWPVPWITATLFWNQNAL